VRIVLPLLALALAAGCYRRHARPEDERPDASRLDAGRELPDVEPTCATGPFDVVRHEVRFDARMPACPWGAGDNLRLEQAIAAARIEQVEELESHSGARLCSLGLDFGPGGTRFRYDDNFFLIFGDVVLAASDRGLVTRLPRDGDLRLWRWADVAGAPMAVTDNEPYCLGADEGRARCEIPGTEEAGIARMEFDSDLVEELVARSGPATITFVTVGDNDPELDCAHDAFSFDFIGTYLRP
jgi:hypothetical protein